MLITAYPSGAIHLGSGANVIIEASGNNNHDHHHHDHRHDHAEGGDRAGERATKLSCRWNDEVIPTTGGFATRKLFPNMWGRRMIFSSMGLRHPTLRRRAFALHAKHQLGTGVENRIQGGDGARGRNPASRRAVSRAAG